jgi:H+/gluconate symporter-like permease
MVELYQFAVLLAGLALLMALVVRGRSIFVVGPLCAALTTLLSGRDPVAALAGPYMTGFADYVRNFYLVFVLGAAFGRLYEESGAAAAVADRIGGRLGRGRACLAVVLACAVLTYGGVSLFVVGFSVHPLAVSLFRAADLPRRFIPAAIAFGSITFTMTSAGSPEIQNLIPIKYLVDATTGAPLTDAMAGWPVSLIVAAGMFLVGQAYLDGALRRAVARGERWEPRAGDVAAAEPTAAGPAGPAGRPPSFAAALAPLVVTVLALNGLPWLCRAIAPLAGGGPLTRILEAVPADPALAVFLGVATGLVTLGPGIRDGWRCLAAGFGNGLVAIASIASVVGFGAAVQGLPAFQAIVAAVTRLPGDPLAGAAIAVAVIAALAGSASGGQGIAFPIIKPIYVDALGVAPRALHRVVTIASGTLDSLPSNGFVVMLVHSICGETHARAYGPIFVTTVLLPLGGTIAAILLFRLVPAWAAF